MSFAQEEIPVYLSDRGTGIPISIFGTYVRDDELLVYPFYEYYHDSNLEYEPFDFGIPSIQEFRGQYKAHEFLIFLGYGISDRLALEFEAGVITATLTKSENDTSSLESEFTESGISDVEGQLRGGGGIMKAQVCQNFLITSCHRNVKRLKKLMRIFNQIKGVWGAKGTSALWVRYLHTL